MKTNKIDLIRKRPLTPRFQMIYLKVKNIIKGQFDLKLVYHSFPEQGFKNENVFKSLLKNNSPLYLLDKLVFPVYLNDLMIGIVEIKDGQKLAKKQVALVKSLVELLSISQNNSSKLEALTIAEEQMARNHQESQSNLVFLKPNKGVVTTAESGGSKKSEGPWLEFSALIKSNSYNDIRMMAQELHSMSSRYAFINSDDLELHGLNLESFNEMGPITLLVPELSHLGQSEIQLLHQVILQDSEAPQLLPKIFLGSIYSIETLIKGHMLNDEVLKKLGLFNMDKSFFDLKKSGLNQFFYTELQKRWPQ